MKKLTNKDLLSLEEYDSNRETIKKEVIESKKHRSINIGNNIILLFESFETIKYQVQEMLRIEKIFKKEIITPGIRFENDFNDQKRVVTPKKAYLNGSDWIVIGRPITKGNIKKNIQKLIDHLN